MNHRLVATSLFIVLASFFGLGEAKCKFRESRTGPEEIRPFRRCLPSNSQVGDEYWTTIGYDGEIKGGRSKADFMTFEGHPSNGWVGYWITRSRYPGGKHYESFGHVFEKPDGRLCGWFVGLEAGEVVEVCGGFRILSRNRFNPNEENPFEWIPAANAIPRNSLGFHHHRIARYQPVDANAFYGDAKLQDKEFKGVSPDSERITEIRGGGQFEDDVWILKRRRDNAFPPQEIRRPLPPTTTTQDPNHLWKYYDPHEHQGIVVDDRGGLRYPNQKITQLNYPPAQRYASADQDPRFNAYRRDSRLHVMPQRTGSAAQDPRYAANAYGNPQQAADPYADNSGSNYQIGQGGQPSAHKIGHGVQAESAAQAKASNPEETYGSGDNQVVGGYRVVPPGRNGPSDSQGQGSARHGYHLAPAHRQVIVTDQYGRQYERRVVNNVAHYIPVPAKQQAPPAAAQSHPKNINPRPHAEVDNDDQLPDLPVEKLPPPREVPEETEDDFFF